MSANPKEKETLSSAILEAGRHLQRNGRARPDLMYRTLKRRHPRLLAERARTMIVEWLWRRWASMQAEKTEQMVLPGLEGVPRSLILEDANGAYSVDLLGATLAQVREAEKIREDNTARVTARRDSFRAFVRKITPVMEGNPSMTVKEALVKLGLWHE